MPFVHLGWATPGSQASCLVLGQFAEDRVHPTWGEPQVLEQLAPLFERKRSLQVFAPLPCDMLLAQLAERLDEHAAEPPGRFLVLRRGPAEVFRLPKTRRMPVDAVEQIPVKWLCGSGTAAALFDEARKGRRAWALGEDLESVLESTQ